MRRLALLLAGGALWLVFMAIPVFADGGPHVMVNNNGTGTIGLAGDCAGCHRAHRGQAADLLKATMPALCLSCHDGTGATTNVQDGFQYVPTGTDPAAGLHEGDAVLGALRGGGFEAARIGEPARLSYSRNGYTFTWATAPTTGSVDIEFGAFTSGLFVPPGAKTLTIAAPFVQSTIQSDADALWGTTTRTYAGSTTTSLMRVTVTDGKVILFTPENELRSMNVPQPTIGSNSTDGGAITPSKNYSSSMIGHIAPLTSSVATTSNHMFGMGVVWGNGPQGQGNPGATGVSLVCTNCHNPHGNGQYRILNPQPGEDWTDAAGVADWTEPETPVVITDVGVTTSTKNYTILPGVQATDVAFDFDQGDYWRKVYDATGFSNYTNYYLASSNKDPMQTGWVGAFPPTAAAAPTNSTGAMTAWCIQCHTRYNGYLVNPDGSGTFTSSGGAPQITAQTPHDAIFMYKHGTVRYGCEQCHVSHGTNVAMNGPAAAIAWPDGTQYENSALLKVQNRGTCQLCHDPTGTLYPGIVVGNVTNDPTSGP